MSLISVEQADALIAEVVSAMPTTSVALADGVGRVLRQNLVSDRPLPPFDRVTMDGFALRSAEYASGQRDFPLSGSQRAGQPATHVAPGTCVEIATGAVLPDGADCVVPVELTQRAGETVSIDDEAALSAGSSVHPCGSDRARGDVLVRAGTVLGPADLGIAASVGASVLEVAAIPRVWVLSTGDELVAVDEGPAPHQIRRSNVHAIAAAVTAAGLGEVTTVHCRDDRDALLDTVRTSLSDCDVLILTGGVSKGRADYVPGVLDELGVERRFHGVRQRPGKPMWFGTAPGGALVFGLPGNPVSALVGVHRYVLSALRQAVHGTVAAPAYATLTEPCERRIPLCVFLPVRVELGSDGGLRATPLQTNTSGDFSALADTDGFIALSEAIENYPVEQACRLWFWRRPSALM